MVGFAHKAQGQGDGSYSNTILFLDVMPNIPYLLIENGNFISNCMLCEILHFDFLELFSLRRKKIDLTKTGHSL